MKKKFMILSVAMASIFGFSAFAQCPDECTNSSADNAQCVGARGPQGPQDKRYRPTNMEEIAFEGILLTPEQQASVNQLKADAKAKCEQAKAQQAAKDANTKAERMAARQEAQREYLKQLQSILTPEQYVTYLENIVVAQPQGGKAGKVDGKCRPGQSHRGQMINKDKKGDKDKAKSQAPNTPKDKKDKKNKK